MIYGGGAVGLGMASCLLRSGCAVDIVGRAKTVAALKEAGLVRTGIFGESRAAPDTFGASTGLAELEGASYDFILVCTKSYDSAGAAQDLCMHGGKLGNVATLILLQNGWGNAECFTKSFAADRVYSGRVITGFHRHRPNEVEVTVHADAIHVGSLFGADVSAVKELCRAIREGGVPCETSADVGRDLWAKMLYNCALNPLGAILRVPYGALVEQATTRVLMDSIVGEVFAVMTVAGFRTHWKTAEGFLKVFYERLVPDTAEHESSMLQDLAAGKRTEIEALNGAVLRLADGHGCGVPHNRAVYNLIKFVESRG